LSIGWSVKKGDDTVAFLFSPPSTTHPPLLR
jgi:hypothetical protein